MRRPAFWAGLTIAAVLAAAVGIRYFPQAFSIVALDITMDRGHALARFRPYTRRRADRERVPEATMILLLSLSALAMAAAVLVVARARFTSRAEFAFRPPTPSQ